LDLKAAWREKPDSPKHPGDMSLQELSRAIRLLGAQNADTKQHWVKVHEKFSIPFACLVFGLIAVPLGIQARGSSASKSMGFSWSLGVLLVYYLMTNLGTSLAERGHVILELGMWAPNTLLLALGLYLLIKAAQESPVFFIVWLNRFIEKIRRIGKETLGSKKWGSGE
jgi:lipopolysaccharide export system permease protein